MLVVIPFPERLGLQAALLLNLTESYVSSESLKNYCSLVVL